MNAHFQKVEADIHLNNHGGGGGVLSPAVTQQWPELEALQVLLVLHISLMALRATPTYDNGVLLSDQR